MESRQSGDGSAAAATECPDAADAPGDLRERVPLHRRDVERVAVPDREDPGRVAPGSRRRPSRSAGSARQVGEPVVADRRAPVDPESPEGGDLTAVPARGATRPARAVPAVAADARPCGRRPSVTAMAPEDVRDRVRRHVEVPDSEGDHAAGRPAIPAAAAVAGGTGGAVSTLASP